jgi:putative copper export protein
MKIAVAAVHFFFATIWLGSAFFYAVLLLPRLRTLDSAQGTTLKRSLRSVMTPLLVVSAVVTIVSGLAMMVELHSLHPGPLSHTRWGISLVIGTLASVAAVAIAVAVESMLRREDRRRVATGARRRARPLVLEESSLRLIALALLLLALVAMAVARYS